MEALSQTCTMHVVSSQNTLYFDFWHGKHPVSHMSSYFFLRLKLLRYYYYFYIVSLILLFDVYYFPAGFGWVPRFTYTLGGAMPELLSSALNFFLIRLIKIPA